MPTVTLSTTTLDAPVGASDTRIKVGSTSGLTQGTRLFIPGPDRELMTVVGLDVSPWVLVIRGVDGTFGQQHASGLTMYIGRADQFYHLDPVGRPADDILVSPHCNVLTGDVWFSQGDGVPGGGFANRWWQKQTTVYDVGPLGVRSVTQSPTSST